MRQGRLPGATRGLAEFAYALRWPQLPESVQAKLKRHVLDAIGCGLVGTTFPWVADVRAYALGNGAYGAATVMGTDRQLVPEWAAFANGTAMHGFELDDYHTEALAHPGCVVVPAVLAVAEAEGASGQDALVACAVGFESLVRIGLAVSPNMVVDRGFHETATQGVFGAALAVANLLQLTPDQTVAALGIAGSHASGTRAYSHSGSEIKRMHAGLGAMGGIRAALMARAGLTGPSEILEGECGFFAAFADSAKPEEIWDQLTHDWRLLDCGIKPYANCGLIHPSIEAVRTILGAHPVNPSEIERIDVGTDRLSLEHVGSLPLRPHDMNGAQFNLPYSLGMAIVLGGNGLVEYQAVSEANFDLPDVLTTAAKVHMFIDDEADRAFPETFVAKVRVRLKNGSVLEQISLARGSKHLPLSDDEVQEKFVSNLRDTPWSDIAPDVAACISSLEGVGDVRELTSSLRGPA